MSTSIESKKEEFRKYLEKNGVVDALTKVLVGLYETPEKPNNALEFLTQHMLPSGSAAGAGDVEALKAENASLKANVESLTEQVAALKAKVTALGGDA